MVYSANWEPLIHARVGWNSYPSCVYSLSFLSLSRSIQKRQQSAPPYYICFLLTNERAPPQLQATTLSVLYCPPTHWLSSLSAYIRTPERFTTRTAGSVLALSPFRNWIPPFFPHYYIEAHATICVKVRVTLQPSFSKFALGKKKK